MAIAQTYDLAAVRAELPSLKDVTYVNTGTEGIMAESVRVAYVEMLTQFEQYGHYVRKQIVGEMDRARASLARVVKADPEEIAVTRNGTEGVSMILGSFPFEAGDELVIGGEEHPAIAFPAFALQERVGIKVRRFRFCHDPAESFEAYKAALSPRTRFVAFSHVSCESGIRLPAQKMTDLAHERGIPVLVDGAQSYGTLPVDFHALGCDYLTGSVHKWLCGPKGTGVLVIRRDRVEDIAPHYVGGGSFADPFPWDMLDEPENVHPSFLPAAARFEFGMRNPAIYGGISSAVDYLEHLGWEKIFAHEEAISSTLKARLRETTGVRVQTPGPWEHSSALVNFALEGISGQDLSKKLWDDWKIVQRAVREPNGIRISCAYFVSDQDIDRLIQAVTTIRDSL